MADPLSGHTAAGHPNGSDGLRDGDSLSSPTLTNLLQGVKGNGILRLQDAAFGSNRNYITTNNQPGSVTPVSGTPSFKLDIGGGYAVLDGQLYEFAGGPGNTVELELGGVAQQSAGSGTKMLADGTDPATNQQSMYVVYIASLPGNKKRVYADGGSVVDISKGLYPSLPSGYLTDYSSTSQKNEQVVVLATVRCTYHASGGEHKVNILEVNDKRHFLSTNPIYMAPLTTGTITTDSGSKNSQISRAAGEGIQTATELGSIFGGTEVGDIGTTANTSTNLIDVGAMWMSTSKSGGGVAATATITNTGSISENEQITIISTNGTSKTYIAKSDASGSDLHFDRDGTSTEKMTSLKAAIESSGGHDGKITITQASGELTLTQAVAGVDGNTTITENLSNTTKTNFTNGVSYGFGPGNGLDRGTNQMKDELFFAGQNNTESALVSKRLFSRGVSAPSFTDATCDTTNNDATVTMDDTSSLIVGMTVTGTGIPSGATVASITNSTTFELSANATATNSNQTLTFGIIKVSATYTITSYGDSVFILNPAASKVVTLKPEKSGSNYLFPEGHTIEVVNSASSGGGNIVFDSAGLNSTVAPEFRATFIFEGSVWLRTAYETSTSAAATTFLTLTDTPSAFSAAAASFDASLKGLRVNAAGNAIEFYDIPVPGASLPGIDDQSSSKDDQITITDTAVTINVDHDNLDFKVISDDETVTLHVDGDGAGKVGINQATPEMTLQMDNVGFDYDGGTGSATTTNSNPSTALTIDLFHIQKFRSAKLLVETENEDEEKYEVAEIVVTTPYKSNSTISSDAEMPIQVYGVTSSDSQDNNPGTAVVNTYAVYAESSNSKVQLRVTPAHTGDTVKVRAFWYAIGL